MEEGFVAANSYNLPKFTVDMVIRFFAANTRTNAKKCAVGESYGDRTIRCVQLKREGGMCTVKSRMTPEHAINSESYRVTVVIDEDEDLVQACQCEDCAACPDACRHAEALLLWLHRRSEEPATSDTTSYWESSPFDNHDDSKPIMTVKEMFGIKNSTETKQHCETTVFDEFIKEAKKRNIDCALMRYYRKEKQALSLHQLCVSRAGQLRGPQALLDALVAKMNSVADSDKTPWCEIWYGRIQDSMLHDAVHCPDQKTVLVERILGEDLRYTPEEVAKRKLIKEAVLKQVAKKEKITITEGGLLLNSEYPILGAAPDAVADELTIEIKCPSDDQALLSYVKDNKLAKELWTQVQAQMYFSKKRKALFCVAVPDFEKSKTVEIFHVPFDESIVSILYQAQQFWTDAVFPELQKIYNN